MWYLFFSLICGAAIGDLAHDREKILLPGDVIPEHYNLTIFTYIHEFNVSEKNGRDYSFSGLNVITVRTEEKEVVDIVLHSHDSIDIITANLTTLQGEETTLDIGLYNEKTNKQILRADPPLKKNSRYNITFEYYGRNSDIKTGFYKSSYMKSNERRWFLVTDFAPSSARRAFPCFDEPRYKATFQLTSHISEQLSQSGYTTRSNTEVESESTMDAWHITKFKKTPVALSTYIMSFMVSDLKESPEPAYLQSSLKGENNTKQFITVGESRFFEPRQDWISQVVGPATLKYLTKKTGVGYGMDKMTQAGIPNFATVAMENWGLITYRENLLFWDNTTGTALAKQQAIHQIVHELAHQWFGNLVTLHWWTDIWLNEGFATFFQTQAADKIREPDVNTKLWDLVGQYIAFERQEVSFFDDGYNHSRPLTAETYDVNEIISHFDSISYEKGSNIIRMWMHIFGEETFYAGLGSYLTSQSEGIGTPEKLLSSFDQALNSSEIENKVKLPLPATELLSAWHLEGGYPVVSAKRNKSQITLTQERFVFDGESQTRYNIPITFSTNLEYKFNQTQPAAWLLATHDNMTLELQMKKSGWFIINNQATGYYRVNYDKRNWMALLRALNTSKSRSTIHKYNRAQILDDAVNLAFSLNERYGRMPYQYVFALMSTIRLEKSPIVWKTALSLMNRLLINLEPHQETHEKMKTFIANTIQGTFRTVNLTVNSSDFHLKRIGRMELVELACKIDATDCRQQANDQFNSKKYHPDVRRTVMCEAIRSGDDAFWNSTLDSALASEDAVRDDSLASLVCTNNEVQLSRLLEMTVNENTLREVDSMVIVYAAASRNAKTAEMALKAVRNREWNSVLDKLKFQRILARNLVTESSAKIAEQLDQNMAEKIRVNAQWLIQKQPKILKALNMILEKNRPIHRTHTAGINKRNFRQQEPIA